MTHDAKSYIITQHHTSWYESKAVCIVYYEIQGQKTHKGGVARVSKKWTCLLHPCAIQYPHHQRIRSICLQWQHSETVCIQYWLSHINGLWLCVCDALLCGCEDWRWSAHWAQFAAKVLKNIRLLGAMCQESQVSCQRVSEQPSPVPLPLATDLARNTRWNRNSKAPLAPASFWDSWHIDSSVYTPMLTWLETIQIMYSLEKLWDAIAPISLRHSPLLSVEWFVQELFCEGGLAKQRKAGTLSVERKQIS